MIFSENSLFISPFLRKMSYRCAAGYSSRASSGVSLTMPLFERPSMQTHSGRSKRTCRRKLPS